MGGEGDNATRDLEVRFITQLHVLHFLQKLATNLRMRGHQNIFRNIGYGVACVRMSNGSMAVGKNEVQEGTVLG
jgi:hypothetical protein